MSTSEYAFADRAHEQRRLANQAELFDPLTERLFSTAGLGNGMRVLDLGSGAGDVAMLAARLVGSEGEVVGVERDPEAVASATARVTQAGLSNVRFIQGDAQTLDGVADGFDAAVGRLVWAGTSHAKACRGASDRERSEPDISRVATSNTCRVAGGRVLDSVDGCWIAAP